MPALADQTVLITGAAQGLGAGIAKVFAAHGARLVLIDRQDEALQAFNDRIGGGAQCLVSDLADPAALDAAMAQINGPVGTLIHNAALLRFEQIEDVSLSTFQATMDVGIQAAFQMTQALWPGMKANGGGALIFVSSQSGIKGFVGESPYCAVKHALEGFSKCLALEGAEHGIVSCTITPGKAMRTPMSEKNYPPELKAQWIDPARLAPAFVQIATTRDPTLSGQRLNAWTMSEPESQ